MLRALHSPHWTALANVTATGLFLLLSPLMARVLEPAGRGQFAAAQTLVTLAPVLAGLGRKDAAAWVRARNSAVSGLPKRLTRLNHRAIVLSAAVFLAVAAGSLWRHATTLPLVLTAVVLAATMTLQFQAEVVLGTWIGAGTYRRLGNYFLAVALAQATTLVLLALVNALTSLTATAGLLFWYVASVLWRLKVGAAGTKECSSILVTECNTRAKEWIQGLICTVLLSRIDIIFLSLIAPPAVLGIYTVASTAGLLAQPVIPALTSSCLRAAHAGQRTALRFIARVILVATAPIVGVAITGYLLLPVIFGSCYRDSGVIFVVLCLAGIGNLAIALASTTLGAWRMASTATRDIRSALAVGAVSLLGIAFLTIDGQTMALMTACVTVILNGGLAVVLLARVRTGPADSVEKIGALL